MTFILMESPHITPNSLSIRSQTVYHLRVVTIGGANNLSRSRGLARSDTRVSVRTSTGDSHLNNFYVHTHAHI